jgi:hypothetical protein
MRAAALTLLFLVVAWPARPAAHDIPVDVLIQVFVRPAGDTLQVLVRAPLAAMRDVDYPRRGENFVDLSRADEAFRNAATLWIANGLSIHEEGTWVGRPRLTAVRAALPSDRSFDSFDHALQHLRAPPLPVETDIVWAQSMLDVQLEYPIASDRARFAIEPGFERLGVRVVTVVRFLPPGAAERVFQFTGNPGLVQLDPRWHQAAWRFVVLGFEHILDGIDHLLFLFCLVLPFRQIKPLVIIVTSFTVAHSITLISAATNVAPDRLWFPPLIETLIAASIVYMAVENIYSLVARGAPPPLAVSLRRRWVLTFAFGLVHGFGFSFALRETLQLAGSHVATSLVAFNLGVEAGQLAVLALLVPLLQAAFRYLVAERIGIIIASALVCHTAWHWMVERGSALGEHEWTAPDAATMAAALRWAIALVIAAGAAWALSAMRTQRNTKEQRASE